MIDELARLPGLAPDDVLAPVPAQYRRDLWPLGLKASAPAADGAVLVRPTTTAAVAEVLRFAGDRGLRVAPFGAGTNVVGALDGGGADILLALERMNRLVSLDPVSQLVTVEAGMNGGELERALAAEGFTLGHYPQSLEISTVGGWVAMRATGTCSTRYGGIERLLAGVVLVLPDGQVVSVGPRVRPPGGLDLLALACGSEGTFGIVTEATLSVQRPLPERIVCAAFDSLADGIELQRELVQGGYRVALLRLYNAPETLAVAPPGLGLEGRCLLIASFVGPEEVVPTEAAAAARLVERLGGSIVPPEAATPWLERRYRAAGLMEEANAPRGHVFDTIEVSLPWASAAECAAELERELAGLSDPYYLHFSHAYTSGACLYMMLHVDAEDDAAAVAATRRAWARALETVARHGGAIGHHHGIGAIRGSAYAASAEGALHARIRRALDERGVLRSAMLEAADEPV